MKISINPVMVAGVILIVFTTMVVWAGLVEAWTASLPPSISTPGFVPVTGDTATPGAANQAATTTQEAAVLPGPTLTASLTAVPTGTFTPTNTDTLMPTAMNTFTPTTTPCGAPGKWATYRIQRGDTLYRLALRTGTTVQKLMLANCLTSTVIRTGDLLRVPELPPTPTFTWTPTQPPPTSTWTPTPSDTVTPSVVPSPDLTVSLTVGDVTYDYQKSSWTVPVTVVVDNQGRGPANNGAAGQVTYKTVSSHYLVDGKVDWSIPGVFKAGEQVQASFSIVISDPSQGYGIGQVDFQAMMDGKSSEVVTKYLGEILR